MADFCEACSIELFGKDYGDLKGLFGEDESKAGMVVRVICEGCGFTEVNHLGQCVAVYCSKHSENAEDSEQERTKSTVKHEQL
jgi:hypothetical protein